MTVVEEEVLGRFLGDDAFPVTWETEGEQGLFWVYDDLHCPHPLSPMYFDIGGWWLTCDHMFRRFGTPFACDWITKSVNGYLYTAAVPARPDATVDAMEYGARYGARVPLDPDYADRIGAYLDAVLPVYGREFATWWRDRLVPEMQRNFAYLEAELDRQDERDLANLACLLEDAIDVHDRHWKIHWMLNFAQLSATLNLRAVAQKTRGEVDEALLGRLQNSARDRNWDSIEALWKMKQEAKSDPELAAAFRHESVQEIIAALRSGERGRQFIALRVEPYQREFGWHAVWSHEFVFPTVREQMEPVIETVRGYIDTDYDYPTTIRTMEEDIRSASAEILAGLEGDALEEMRAANEMNLRMAPLTPDHHFYIDQGANAHLRLVLIAIGRKLVAQGLLDAPDDVMFLRYNELREFIGNPAAVDAPAAGLQASCRTGTRVHVRAEGLDRHGHPEPARLPVPDELGLPRQVLPEALGHRRADQRDRRLSGRDRGDRQGRRPRGPVRRGQGRRDRRLPDDEPGMGRALHEDRRARHGRGRDDVAPGGALPRVRHPGGGRHVRGHARDPQRRSHPRQRDQRPRGDPAGGGDAQERPARPVGRPMSESRLISRDVLSDQIEDHLLQAILTGAYPPGSRIVETRVARELGVSQAPVREALRDLEALGVVEITSFRGARVRRPSKAELLEAYGVRAELESLGARLAMARMSEADLDELQGCVDEMQRAAAAGDRHAEALVDGRFHARLIEATGNRTLERVWRYLMPVARTYITLAGARRGCRRRGRPAPADPSRPPPGGRGPRGGCHPAPLPGRRIDLRRDLRRRVLDGRGGRRRGRGERSPCDRAARERHRPGRP